MSTLIRLEKIHKSYGERVILGEVNLSLGTEHKVGVVGRNGAGKTTLCRILTREEEPDSGEIVRSPGLRLGYLEQQDPFDAGETVLEFLRRYTGREEWHCGRAVARLQLRQDMLGKRIGDLSGGFRTRVKLVAMLLQEPNLLVLDEPSNYLDLRTLILLENLLEEYDGGVLIVSHDRQFLKRTCRQTLEIEHGRANFYPGDIEEYLEQKEKQRELIERHNENVEAERKRLQRFVDRFRAKATKAAQAQSKLKQLSRLHTIGIDHPVRSVRIRLPQVEPRKGIAVTCQDLAIGYPAKLVAEQIHVEVQRGEHVAVLGDNGEGKTTFLRTLAGDLAPKAGDFRWGYGLQPAWYAQHVYAALNPEDDILAHLQNMAAPDVTRQEILDLAGSFLFSGDDILKKIRLLSGGERARVCLAGLLLSKNPVLLLDEPNSHLDFEAVEALAYALQEYRGTIFFTSHDRTFVHLVATGILEVKGGRIAHYPDTYETYVHLLENLCGEAEGGTEETEGAGGAAAPKPVERRSRYRQERERKARLRTLTADVQAMEGRMHAHERERDNILQYLTDNPKAWSREHHERLEELSRMLEEEEASWFRFQEEIEEIEAEEAAGEMSNDEV